MDYSLILNEASLNELKELLEEGFEDLIKTFKESAHENIKNILNHTSDNNITVIIEEAHELKGSAANLGLIKLSDLAGKIELGLRKNSSLDISEEVKSLEPAFDETISALQVKGFIN